MIWELSYTFHPSRWEGKEIGFALQGTSIACTSYPAEKGTKYHVFFQDRRGRIQEYRRVVDGLDEVRNSSQRNRFVEPEDTCDSGGISHLREADLQAADPQAPDPQAWDFQVEDLQAEDLQADDLQADDLQADDLQAEDLQAGDLQGEYDFNHGHIYGTFTTDRC